jgi:Uma2 family endonuclease
MASKLAAEHDFMSFDDFEELLADKPKGEKWELIGGRVVKLMVGARWEHGRIVQNIARLLENAFEAGGSRCQTFAERSTSRGRTSTRCFCPTWSSSAATLSRGRPRPTNRR